MQYSTARCSECYVFKEKHIPVIHWTDIRVDPASVQLTQMIKYFKAHQKMWSWVSQQPLPQNETIAQGFVASHALRYRSIGLKPIKYFRRFFHKRFSFLLLIVMYVGTVTKTFHTLKRRGSLLRRMRGVASHLSWVQVSCRVIRCVRQLCLIFPSQSDHQWDIWRLVSFIYI